MVKYQCVNYTGFYIGRKVHFIKTDPDPIIEINTGPDPKNTDSDSNRHMKKNLHFYILIFCDKIVVFLL